VVSARYHSNSRHGRILGNAVETTGIWAIASPLMSGLAGLQAPPAPAEGVSN
jgi:hypothetical protein